MQPCSTVVNSGINSVHYGRKYHLARKTFTFRFTGKTSDGKEIPFPAVRLAILDRDEKNNNLTIATGLPS